MAANSARHEILANVVWSGRTAYRREWDETRSREVFVPVSVESVEVARKIGRECLCWYVKRDTDSGKPFFVSCSGVSRWKRWKLPDLLDPTVAAEARAHMDAAAIAVVAATPSRGSPSVSPSIDPLSVVSPPINAYHPQASKVHSALSTPAPTEGGSSRTVSSPPHASAVMQPLYSTTPHNQYQRQEPRTFPGDPGRGTGSSAPPATTLSALDDDVVFHTPPGTSKEHRIVPAADDNDDAPDATAYANSTAFNYDDPSWVPIAAERQRRETLKERDRTMAAERDMVAKEMERRGTHDMIPRRALQQLTSPSTATAVSTEPVTPPDESKFRYALHSVQEGWRHRDASLRQELDALSAEEARLAEEAAQAEASLHDLMEAQANALQLAALHNGTSHPEVVVGASATTHANASPVSQMFFDGNESWTTVKARSRTSPTRTPVDDGSTIVAPLRTSSHASDEGHMQHRRVLVIPDSGEESRLLSVIKTLEQLLDRERETNLKLTHALELEERKRLVREAAEVEREQREIALRIRMLEAMAVHRREQQLLELRKQQNRGEDFIRTSLAEEAARSAHTNRHPLEGV